MDLQPRRWQADDQLRARLDHLGRLRPTRRGFLRLGAGAAGVGLAGGGLLLPRALAHGQDENPLVEPAVRASSDGLLDTTLAAMVSPTRVGGQQALLSVYEGTFPGPTLRVRPGDRIRIKLVNNLAEGTNLHVHGLHVSPRTPSDNVLLHVMPGETFQYEYQLPADHPAGLYWYHPHLHGTVHEQVFGGMAGAIIIEGDLDRLPGIAGLPERLLVLQATQVGDDGRAVSAPRQRPGNQRNYLRLVNGQLNPTITIRPGETQRWRIGNFSSSSFFRLFLEGHQLHQIAKDGNTLRAVRTRDEIVLVPAERVEVLVRGGPAGTYALRSLIFNPGFSEQPDVVLATLVSQGEPVTPRPLPATLLPVLDLTTVPIDRRRVLSFQARGPNTPQQTSFQFDSKEFDEDRVDQTVQLGATEEWVIRNASAVWHPFHIHINPYQVIAVNGRSVTASGYEDTTGVPPLGEITMRTRFLDFTGRYVFHCHILLHEDGGMMGIVEVVDGRAGSTRETAAYPFTCKV